MNFQLLKFVLIIILDKNGFCPSVVNHVFINDLLNATIISLLLWIADFIWLCSDSIYKSYPVHVFFPGIHPNSVYLKYLDIVEYCLIYKDKSGSFHRQGIKCQSDVLILAMVKNLEI